MTKLHLVDQYQFNRPVAKPVDKVVGTVTDISKILKNPAGYHTVESKVFEKTSSNFSVVADVYVLSCWSPWLLLTIGQRRRPQGRAHSGFVPDAGCV